MNGAVSPTATPDGITYEIAGFRDVGIDFWYPRWNAMNEFGGRKGESLHDESP